MDRRYLGLRPLAPQRIVNLSDSSSSDDDDDDNNDDVKYKQSKIKRDSDIYRSESNTSASSSSSSSSSSSDSSDSDFIERKRKQPKSRQVNGRNMKRKKRNISDESDSSDYNIRIVRTPATRVSYKEQDSEESADDEEEEEEEGEEDQSQVDTIGDDSNSTVTMALEDNEKKNEEVETIDKVLRKRIGRQGATGSQTVSYVASEEGDPNAGLDPEKEETEEQYLIKWKNWSYIHSSWESDKSLKSQNVNGMKKLDNFKKKDEQLQIRKQFANREDLEYLACHQEMDELLEAQHFQVERIINGRVTNGLEEYLVKWEGLPYSSCTAEDVQLIGRLFPKAVEEFYYRRNNTRTPNSNCRTLRYRPKFIPLKDQPMNVGGGEEKLRLRDYQLDGLNWLLHAWSRDNSVILADEMGLGKTIQTISFLEVLMSVHEIYGPFLILVPLSTIATWCREFKLWTPHINVVQYLGDVDSRTRIREEEFYHPGNKKLKFNVLLSTYEILLKDKLVLGSINWAVLAVDEAHRLKNDESLLYKSLVSFHTNHRLLITGTPLQNSLKELWALLHFLMPKKYDRWEDFEWKHKAADTTGFQHLHAELGPFLLRRVKKDVEKSLPAKVEQILRVEMSKLQKQYYKFVLTKNYKELCKRAGGKVSSFINIIMELKKCCNHAFLTKEPDIGEWLKNRLEVLVKGSGKLILLDKLLLRLKETGHRVLIFSQMVRMLDILEDYMRLRQFAFQRLDGSIRGEQRKQALDHFNAEGSQDFCFLLSTRAGGLGLNLATADTVIIFDSDWNPQNDLQAQARAHRIGQKNQVSVYRLVTKASVEEDILERAKKKMVLDHLVIQRMDTTGKTILNKDTQSSTNPFSKDELNAILKFGAEELFKDSDEEDGDLQVDIDDILQRAETRNTEDLNNGASNELLSCFKVVSFDNLEDEALEGQNKSNEQVIDKSWQSIIPEAERRRIEDEELHQQLKDLNPPPRSRKNCKTVNYNESKDSLKRKLESSDSENERAPKKRGRPKTAADEFFGFKRIEMKRLLKSLKKFGRPQERLDAIVNDCDLLHKSKDDLSRIVNHIIKSCQEIESNHSLKENDEEGVKTHSFKLGKVLINSKSLLQSFRDLEVLCVWVDQGTASFPIGHHVHDSRFDCNWNIEDDLNLMRGVYEYGFGSWDAIKMDPKFNLSKILPDADMKPQSRHLVTRVEYLLRKLQRHYDGTNRTKNEKKFIVSEEIIEKPSSTLANGNLAINGDAEKKSKKKKLKKDKNKTSSHHSKESSKNDSKVKLSNDDFLICKEKMRPVRQALKNLGDCVETRNCLIEIGSHIKILLETIDEDTTDEWRSNLWTFVSQFTDFSPKRLHRLYKLLEKKESKKRNSEDNPSPDCSS